MKKFRESSKYFAADDMALVTRKGVYLYEYTDGWDKSEENTLPEKKDFYSVLTESGIKDDEYDHTVKVWGHFGCETLCQYSDLGRAHA